MRTRCLALGFSPIPLLDPGAATDQANNEQTEFEGWVYGGGWGVVWGVMPLTGNRMHAQLLEQGKGSQQSDPYHGTPYWLHHMESNDGNHQEATVIPERLDNILLESLVI